MQSVVCKWFFPLVPIQASRRNHLLRAEPVEGSQMGQVRLELLQAPSVCCLADIFLPVYAVRILTALASVCLLWDSWWLAILATRHELCYSQCYQEQTVVSICGGTI